MGAFGAACQGAHGVGRKRVGAVAAGTGRGVDCCHAVCRAPHRTLRLPPSHCVFHCDSMCIACTVEQSQLAAGSGIGRSAVWRRYGHAGLCDEHSVHHCGKNSGEALQSGFHGLYSVGGILGAGALTALLSLGLEPVFSALCVVIVVMGCLYKSIPSLLTYGTEKDGPIFALPKGIVFLLGALCFIVFLTEGAVLDWGAVFLVSSRNMEPTLAGLGYASFAAAMTLGRLTGDAIVRRFGGVRVMAYGGIIAATGMLVSLGFEGWPASLLGYALLGAGCSNIVPVL